MDKETAMTFEDRLERIEETKREAFERLQRAQQHQESMAMLDAERAAVERLREAYRALAEEARAIEARDRRAK